VGNYLSIPILALAAAIQSTLVPQIRLLGGGPDLVFLIVLAWSVNANLESSVTWALVGGICQDLLSAAPIGTSSVGLILVAFGVSQLASQVQGIGLIFLSGLALAGTFVQQVVFMLLLGLFGFRMDFIGDLNYVVFPTMLYNLVLIWPVYWLVRRIQRRFATDTRFFRDVE
jgi:rod shape-determining protein MreD